MRGLTDDDAAAATLGDVQVTALVDVLTSSTTAEIFASSTLPWPLEELSRRFPEDFQDDSWRFIVRCFLVQAGTTAILVDAGAGPATTGMCQAEGIEGQLLDRLGDLGVAEDDIDHVVITHLHEDHVGWLTVPAQGGPRATFPRASYHLHPADFKLAHDLRDSSRGRYWDDTFTPLALSGQLDLHPGARALAPGVAIRNAQGHTPGHRVVDVCGGGRRMLILGDLVHFSFQLADPSIASPFDVDPAAAAMTRAGVLDAAGGAMLASAHLPQAFTVLAPYPASDGRSKEAGVVTSGSNCTTGRPDRAAAGQGEPA